MLGLFDDEQMWAVASAEVSRATGLVVSGLCVYPAELNNDDSTVARRLIHALHVRAAALPLASPPARRALMHRCSLPPSLRVLL